MALRIYLVDRDERLVAAWQQVFAKEPTVVAEPGDYFERDADAMVSPANSFGIMDGGLDAAIRDQIGGRTQQRVQSMILEHHHGEMPVGCAEIVETGNQRWPYLVVAPTMRVPESVSNTLNAYLAFRATLLAVERFNGARGGPIRSLLAPGLGTGIGGVDPRRCAAQMRIAFDQVANPARIPSFDLIHKLHAKLKSAL